jgi:DNA-binding NtrC family response regulator
VKFDARVIAATNRNLRNLVKEGKFREDLFYRLYVVPIEVPPLRERREDIFPLTWHFLKHFNQKYKHSKTFSSQMISMLETYNWPGNVRELQNVVERLVVTGDAEMLTPEHLPPSICPKDDHEGAPFKAPAPSVGSLISAREEVERAMLVKALSMKRTTREVAGLLGIDHSTVVRKLKKYGLNGAEMHRKKRS